MTKVHMPKALLGRVSGFKRSEKLAEAGRRLVDDGVVSINGYPEVAVDIQRDWSANPLGSRSWQWAVAAFRFMPALIAFHAARGEDAAMDWAMSALRSWQRAVAGPLRNYEFAHNDHAVANQAENLVFLLAYLSSEGIREKDQAEIAVAIRDHARLLSTEDFYSRHTNHGIEQSRILAVIGDFLVADPDARDWLRLAVGRLGEELDFAFTKEGVHVENSPGYHAYVCLSFLKILDYFPREEIAELADRIDALMPRAIRFLTHIARPDGTLPIIGDTVNDPIPNYFKRYRKTRDYTHLRYATTDGAEGQQPSQTAVLYPQAGYFIARDAWQPPGEGRSAFHLVLRCGFRSAYHRHDDDLNIVLYCDGEDWLVDSGAYRYAEDDPIRRYVRSKWGHNVPVVRTPPRLRWKWAAPELVLPMLRLPGAEGVSAVRAVTRTYPDHVATRDLIVSPAARTFDVIDTLVPSGSPVRRNYLSLWHIPADKDIRIEEKCVVVTSRLTGTRLVIENLTARRAKIHLVDPGIPGQQGASYSPFSNTLEPVQVLAFEWAGNHLHSLLQFRFEAAAPGEPVT